MKIASFTQRAGAKDSARELGIVTERGIVALSRHLPDAPTSMVALMDQWETLAPKLATLAGLPADDPLADLVLHAPVERPGKIMGIGLNYADHAAESGMEPPSEQLWFCKAVTSVTDPFAAIQLPKVASALDYEA